MLDLYLLFEGNMIRVNINNNRVLFSNSVYGSGFYEIDKLKLSYSGVIKEFPMLKNNPQWREEAIKKFKEKIKSFSSEERTAEYIINDLKKFGYVPQFKQKQGFRKERIK